MKAITHLLKGKEKNIGEETILQSLPHPDFRFASPFIVLHHFPAKSYPKNSPPERLHPHPHRGFAPVTFMFQGEGFHNDSEGNSGTIKGGEVQWMFAGRGLLHSEGPSKQFLKDGGAYEFVQLWVNVPAQNKLDEPFYQQSAAEEMPLISNEKGIELKLASGSYNGIAGPLKSHTPITSIFGKVDPGKSLTFNATDGYWTLLYILDGSVTVNDKEVTCQHLIVFDKAGSEIKLTTHAETKMLYLSGEPINEPVAARGNIVMNTVEELNEADQDFAEGKFGNLDF